MERWGLGIEHEMSFSKSSPSDDPTVLPDKLSIIPSKDIVRRHVVKCNESFYSRVGVKVVSSEMDIDVTYAVSSLCVPCDLKRRLGSSRLDEMSSKDLKQLRAFEFDRTPFYLILKSLFEDAKFADLVVKDNESYSFHSLSELNAIDKRFYGRRKTDLDVLDAVVNRTPDFLSYEKEVSGYLDDFIALNGVELRPSDRIKTGFYKNEVIPSSSKKKKNNEGTIGGRGLLRTIRSIQRKRVFGSTHLDPSVEVDSGFVEVKTTKFKNVRIEDIAADLHDAEQRALSYAREVDGSARIVTYGGDFRDKDPEDPSSNPGKPEVSYTGSFHVWITLPHSPDVSMESFAEAHSALAVNLQWIEPMLLSLTSCDPRSLGSGNEFPRANVRGQVGQNYLSGIATTRACTDLAPLDKVSFRFNYYEGDTGPHVHENPATIYISYDGKTFTEYLVTSSVDRYNVPPYDSPDKLIDRPKPGSPLNASLARLGAKFRMSEGNDIRYLGTEGLALRPGYKSRVIKIDGRFELRFVDRRGRVTVAAPLRDRVGALTGIEFRMMDNMPTTNLLEVARLMTLVAGATDPGGRCVPPLSDPGYVDLVANTLVRGRFAKVPESYLSALESRFSLSLPRDVDVFQCLCRFSELMHSKYAKSKIPSLMTRSFDRPPTFMDQNSEVFGLFLRRKMLKDPKLAESVRTFKTRSRFVREMGPGWTHDAPYLELYSKSQ
jgi:hypothetical protein